MRSGSQAWRRPLFLVAILALVVGLTACGRSADPAEPSDEQAIRIAAFNFAESELLAELYAQVLEDRDLPVTRLGAIGSREVVEPALELGLIDLVPEYAGTMLEFVNLGAGTATADTALTVERLRGELEPRGLTVLEPAAAQDRNVLVVRKGFAAREEVGTISDLLPSAASLTFGGPTECPERYFCLVGLQEIYGLEFGSFSPLPNDIVVAALRTGEIDVGLLFSTDAGLADADLVVLADDRGLQPAENVIPVMRSEALERWGAEAVGALNTLSAALDTVDLITLNRRAEEFAAAQQLAGPERQRALAEVAREWLSEGGLIG